MKVYVAIKYQQNPTKLHTPISVFTGESTRGRTGVDVGLDNQRALIERSERGAISAGDRRIATGTEQCDSIRLGRDCLVQSVRTESDSIRPDRIKQHFLQQSSPDAINKVVNKVRQSFNKVFNKDSNKDANKDLNKDDFKAR